MFDAVKVRADFPIFSHPTSSGKRLAYLDSAATSQKPQKVLDAITSFYTTFNANVHRGVHELSERSTILWEESKKQVARFFGAQSEELIVLRNTTEALNVFALSWGEQYVKEGDVIITSLLEHHSNICPWQRLARKKNAQLVYIPVLSDGSLDMEMFDTFLAENAGKISLIAVTHVSNTLGTHVPIELMVQKIDEYAKKYTAKRPVFLVDGAQAPTHIVENWIKGVDVYAVSAHKMLGPMGIGGLFVRKELLASIDPLFLGGGMIDMVSLKQTLFAPDIDTRWTAGTPDVAGLVGWAAACAYIQDLGSDVVIHDQELVSYALESLQKNPTIEIVGSLDTSQRSGSVAFLYKGVHAHDVAQILDSEGVAVRSGHHCTMPLHTHLGWPATTRVSFSVYSTREDVDQLGAALAKVAHIFHH